MLVISDELFDSEYYAANNNVIPGTNYFTHYNEGGNLIGSDPNSVFDNSYYNSNNPDAAASKMTALEHYQKNWRAGLPGDPNYDPSQNTDFNSSFSSEDYFTIHDDVRVESLNPNAKSPLEDSIAGLTEERITHSLFLSDNILEVTQTINLDGKNISADREKLNEIGLDLVAGEDENYQIVQASLGGGLGDIVDKYVIGVGVTVISKIIVGISSLYKAYNNISPGLKLGIKFGSLINRAGDKLIDYAWEYTVDNLETPTFYEITPSDETYEIPPYLLPEPKIDIEIFRPEGISGDRDYNIFRNGEGEGVIIPRTTEFPQRDPIIEDILNGGIFVGGGDESVLSIINVASTNDGGSVAYIAEDYSNLSGNSWDSVMKNGGDLTTLRGVQVPVRETLPKKYNRFGEEISQSTHGNFTTFERVGNSMKRGGDRIKYASGEAPVSQSIRPELISPSNVRVFVGEDKTIREITGDIQSSLFHAEGHAASTMKILNLNFGNIVINNPAGPLPKLSNSSSKNSTRGSNLGSKLYRYSRPLCYRYFYWGKVIC